VRFLLAALFAAAAMSLPLPGQETVVQTFDGINPATTGVFKVGDKWELRWDSPQVIYVTLLSPDGTIMAGASGSGKGALFQARGGSFYLQVMGKVMHGSSPWHVSIVELGSVATAGNLPGVPLDPNYVPPSIISPPGWLPDGTTPLVAPAASVRTNAVSTADPPKAPVPVVPPPPPPPPQKLTDDQARAVVLLKGDAGEGTGFLVKTADGPAVITNLHVLAANPNIRILTTTGAEVVTTGLKGAGDRDIAMIGIKDDHYSYLDLATNLKDTVEIGDAVLTPGNSEGGEVILDTKGDVLGIGPEKIEFSNPIFHGNSGGPVFHLGSGKVIAVVEGAMKMRMVNDLDKASFASAGSAIGSMRYFGLRPDTVPVWETYDWARFLGETAFLKNFRLLSRCLDSYLNGERYERARLASAGDEDGPPDSRFYLQNDAIHRAEETFHQLSADADTAQRLDAKREAVMTLDNIADQDMDTIRNPANFYGFDEIRAQEEIKYRKYLRDELDGIQDKIGDSGQ
jgi:hypothetical protein